MRSEGEFAEDHIPGAINLPVAPCDDVNFQATTRGGRVMDHVLANKAVFKSATDTAGDAAIISGAILAGAGTRVAALGAVRVMRTCRERGLETVAVYSDAELDLLATEALIRYGYQRRFGKVDPTEMEPAWNFRRGFAAGTDPVDALAQAVAAADAPRARAHVETVFLPGDGAEQDPEAVWAAVKTACGGALAVLAVDVEQVGERRAARGASARSRS